jgi:hypothetical protein
MKRFLIILFLVIGLIHPASVLAISGEAITNEDVESIVKKTPWFDPTPDDEGSTCSQLSGGDEKAQIYNYLIGKKVKNKELQDFHVAGIMGNMQHESAFKPQRLQNTGADVITPADQAESSSLGYGLVQWTPAGKMITAVKARGGDPNTIKDQLDFLLDQLNGGTASSEGAAGEDLVNQTDVAGATTSFETKYERHAGPPQPTRITDAQAIKDAAAGFAAGAAAGTCGAAGTISETLLAYAWPDYSASKVEKKPAYATAITQAQSEGQYVGGIKYPGVDCGGFVTRLMIDSGFEPNYNFAGKTSAGAGKVSTGQITWLTANWEKLSVTDTHNLKPGDVAVNSGRTHTFVFVGSVPGFNSQVASASEDRRAPMAGRENIDDSALEWYRKKDGTSNPTL